MPTIASWDLRYAELKQFKAKRGHCIVPSTFKDNPQLGRWVGKQRYFCRNFSEDNGKPTGGINEERIEMLEEIGFSWSVTLDEREILSDEFWKDRFESLKEYKAKHGHCNLTARCKDQKLHGWVRKQRKYYKNFMEDNGKFTGHINQDRINMLESIGFCWSRVSEAERTKKSDDAWMAQFTNLKTYKAEHGHCNVPSNKANFKLGNWVSQQRQHYKDFRKNNGGDISCKYMNQDRINMLEEIGFCWSAVKQVNVRRPKSTSVAWMAQFTKLKKYKAKYGHCNLSYVEGYLGKWVSAQRRYYKNFMEDNGKETKYMNHERIKILEGIGFCWSIDNISPEKSARELDFRWMDQFTKLKNYKAEHGHCNVQFDFKDKKLANWVRAQRAAKRGGYINQERIKMLEEIGFCWSSDAERKKRAVTEVELCAENLDLSDLVAGDADPDVPAVCRRRSKRLKTT